ncbi:MAG TPA: 6-phosphogluconolactonase [Acidimicrobiia bacterium]|nr:6-phosphogluconolactonase [Acidimicrobiia bacterium]
MTLPGVVHVVDDVAPAFATLVAAEAPHSLALSGGDTARRCYEALRGASIDWSGIDVFFGDERIVPVQSDDSNEGMARRVLLDDVRPHAVHSLVGLGADAYDALVREVPPISIVHLGLGPDGHTASLFPGSPSLDETTRYVVETGDDAHPHRRLTFTFPAIARAQLVIVTVEGPSKREPLTRVSAGDDLPAARIRAERVVWIVDQAAYADG